MDLAGAGDERGDEAGRGLAVEGAAALLEQRRLLVDRRIAVELEQLALDLRHGCRPRDAVELLREHQVVRVEVAQVVRRDRPELLEQLARQADLGRRARPVLGEQRGQHVLAADDGPRGSRSGG